MLRIALRLIVQADLLCKLHHLIFLSWHIVSNTPGSCHKKQDVTWWSQLYLKVKLYPINSFCVAVNFWLALYILFSRSKGGSLVCFLDVGCNWVIGISFLIRCRVVFDCDVFSFFFQVGLMEQVMMVMMALKSGHHHLAFALPCIYSFNWAWPFSMVADFDLFSHSSGFFTLSSGSWALSSFFLHVSWVACCFSSYSVDRRAPISGVHLAAVEAFRSIFRH